MMNRILATAVLSAITAATAAFGDEQVFGYVKGAETLPRGEWEIYETITLRSDKGQGTYEAWDSETEIEKGFTDRFTAGLSVRTLAIETEGLLINGYLPKDEEYGPQFSGIEGYTKYNFLSPIKDPIGLSVYTALTYDWLDAHSGQDKDKLSLELELLLQKYFLDGELIWVGNLGTESTFADRAEIENLPPEFEWPTEPEMEIELKAGTGISYRFAPRWYIGGEALYETEYETEVGQERWSIFAGPTLHYGAPLWWATLTWMPQIEGGGEAYDGQKDTSLHLIEKTEQEVRLKVGVNF